MMPSKTGRAYQIDLHDSLVDPDDPNGMVRFDKRPDDRYAYLVYLHLSGRQLYMVDSVVYELHPEMQPNRVRIARTPDNPFCKHAIWLWGIFPVGARVQLKTGETIYLEHYPTFGDQVRALPAERFSQSA